MIDGAAPFCGLTEHVKERLGYDKKTIGDMMRSPISGAAYTLCFIDDFDGSALNPDNWTIATTNYNQAEE